MVSICEDLPEEINRVTLDPNLRDSDGIPAPKITYRLGENTQRMLDHSVARGIEILKAAGAHDITIKSPLPDAGWHLLGTARMGHDPKRSVVNEWGRSHDVATCSSLMAACSSPRAASIRPRPSRRLRSMSPTRSKPVSTTCSTESPMIKSRAMPFDDAQRETLRVIAAAMIPASEALHLPGADDPVILDDILAVHGA